MKKTISILMSIIYFAAIFYAAVYVLVPKNHPLDEYLRQLSFIQDQYNDTRAANEFNYSFVSLKDLEFMSVSLKRDNIRKNKEYNDSVRKTEYRDYMRTNYRRHKY